MAAKKTAAQKKAAASASRPAQPQEPLCTVPGCDRPILHRGLCAEHWENPKQ
jgi:hypothetical protein